MDIENAVRQQYNVFHKQVDAFEYQKKSYPDGRPFSFEMPNPYMTQGRRKFIIARVPEFWNWYKNFYDQPRHFYEMIQEGVPARLYFDLEYELDQNPDIVARDAITGFVGLVCELLNRKFKIEIDARAFHFLDSTTETKFSMHAVVHLPGGHLFPSNTSMRGFINDLMTLMYTRGVGVVQKDGHEALICDPAVYTKNRSFRIFLSSKCGKKYKLKLRKDNIFYTTEPTEEQIFLDSLVTPIDWRNCPLLDAPEDPRLVLKRNRGPPVASGEGKTGTLMTFLRQPARDVEIIDNGGGPSPAFPLLSQFIIDFNKKYNAAVAIRNWTLLRVSSKGSFRLQFQLNNCRYCFNLLREHKSNNVFWTVVLDAGYMYQRCFDYDCSAFQSNDFPLPEEVSNEAYAQLEKLTADHKPKSIDLDDSFWSSQVDRDFQIYQHELKKPKKRVLAERNAEHDDDVIVIDPAPLLAKRQRSSIVGINDSFFSPTVEKNTLSAVESMAPKKTTTPKSTPKRSPPIPRIAARSQDQLTLDQVFITARKSSDAPPPPVFIDLTDE